MRIIMTIAKVGQIWHNKHGSVDQEVIVKKVDDTHQTITIQYIVKGREPCLTIYLDVFYGFFEFIREENEQGK